MSDSPMTPTQALHSLLTRLGAVPGTIECHDDENFLSSGTWEPVDDSIALGLLCNAASELIESHGLNTTPGTEKMWMVVRPQGGWMPDTLAERDTRAEALIAGLEHLLKQKGRDDANP